MQYAYDDLYRLTNETIAGASAQNGTVGYQYDAVGNRKQLNSTVAAIPATGLLNYDANDRISTQLYDNNGNTVNNGTLNVYDFENRLVQRGNVHIVYDGDGNRVSETVGGATVSYLVADVNPTGYPQVLQERQNQFGPILKNYEWGLQLIAEGDLSQSPLHYYGMDGHGSVRYLTNASGTITDTYDYDAFGNLISSTGTRQNNYLFAGEQFDPALGVYYNRARYFDQRLGRFWSLDKVEGDVNDPLSLHLYLYAKANPADLADPSGKTPLADLVRLLATNGVNITTRLFGLYAHQLIEADIQELIPTARTELGITGGRIDVFIPPNEVYEIKPLGGTVDPERQINRYIIYAGEEFGFPLTRGTILFDRIIDGPLGVTQIKYFTTSPGVIEYTAFPSIKLVGLAISFVITYNLAQISAQALLSIPVTVLAPGLP